MSAEFGPACLRDLGCQGLLPPEPGMQARRSGGVFYGKFLLRRMMHIDSCRHLCTRHDTHLAVMDP